MLTSNISLFTHVIFLNLQMIFVDLQRQMSYLISLLFTYLQIANHLDRAVSNLGRNPLKILVQVNTSGEECKQTMLILIVYNTTVGSTLKPKNNLLIRF